jgi:hypothetical protein
METAYIIILLIIVGLLYKLLQGVQKVMEAVIELGLHLESGSNYPVTDYGRIENQRKKLMRTHEEYVKIEEKVDSFKEHDDGNTPNKEKSEAYKDAMREYFKARAHNVYELNLYRTMVEANWLVKSGKKTIEEAELLIFNTGGFPNLKAGKLYEDWLKK